MERGRRNREKKRGVVGWKLRVEGKGRVSRGCVHLHYGL